jgi:hypothetical protein
VLSIRVLACALHHSPAGPLIEPSPSQPTGSPCARKTTGLHCEIIKMHQPHGHCHLHYCRRPQSLRMALLGQKEIPRTGSGQPAMWGPCEVSHSLKPERVSLSWWYPVHSAVA